MYFFGSNPGHPGEDPFWTLGTLFELDYLVSICSLIPPATAISKTQEQIKHTEYTQSFFLTENCEVLIKHECKAEMAVFMI